MFQIQRASQGDAERPEQTSCQTQHCEGPGQGEPLPPQHLLQLQRPQQPGEDNGLSSVDIVRHWSLIGQYLLFYWSISSDTGLLSLIYRY